jgi:hypothetical protein
MAAEHRTNARHINPLMAFGWSLGVASRREWPRTRNVRRARTFGALSRLTAMTSAIAIIYTRALDLASTHFQICGASVWGLGGV